VLLAHQRSASLAIGTLPNRPACGFHLDYSDAINLSTRWEGPLPALQHRRSLRLSPAPAQPLGRGQPDLAAELETIGDDKAAERAVKKPRRSLGGFRTRVGGARRGGPSGLRFLPHDLGVGVAVEPSVDLLSRRE
jgi:hypothetical protein